MAENKGPGRLHAYLASYSGSEEPLMRLLPARPYIELSSNAKMLVEGCTVITGVIASVEYLSSEG